MSGWKSEQKSTDQNTSPDHRLYTAGIGSGGPTLAEIMYEIKVAVKRLRAPHNMKPSNKLRNSNVF